jgi:hypothetical protein
MEILDRRFDFGRWGILSIRSLHRPLETSGPPLMIEFAFRSASVGSDPIGIEDFCGSQIEIPSGFSV